MKLRDLSDSIGAKILVLPQNEREIGGVYTCDLLSWVMANAKANDAWITIQTHANVVAVAVMLDLGCIIIPEGIKVEENTLEKAKSEGVAVLSCDKSAYEICGILYAKFLEEK